MGSRSIKQMSLRHMELDGGGSVCAEWKTLWCEFGSEQGVQEAWHWHVKSVCAWVGLPALLLTRCVTSDKSPDLDVSQLLIWKSRNAKNLPHGTVERLNGIIHVKCWSVLGAFWVYKPCYCFGSCSEMLVQTVRGFLSQASKGIGSIWKWECNCGSHLMLSEQHIDHHLYYVLYAICFIWHMIILFLSCHLPMYVTLHHTEHLHGRWSRNTHWDELMSVLNILW